MLGLRFDCSLVIISMIMIITLCSRDSLSSLFVCQGVLGPSDQLTAVLTVLANDDPYGVFVVSADSRPVITPSAFTGNFHTTSTF